MSDHITTTKTIQSITHRQAQIRKQLLKLSPQQLKKVVQSAGTKEKEFLDEYDIDFDQPDSWEKGVSEEHKEDSIFMYGCDLDENNQSTAFLDFNDNYIISVYEHRNGGYTCYFEPPSWMTSRISKKYKEVLNGMIRIVQGIASTFENTQQSFLAEPQISLEADQGKISQKDLVKMVSGKNKWLDEGDLSFIKDKIWFVWEKQCFPLSGIFNN
jgi:hypothetical protein